MTSDVAVRFGWTAVGPVRLAEDGQALRWPSMPAGAGVYRFTLRLHGRTRYYVGETDGYKRRFAQYANPGPTQSTNVRMRARLLRLLGEHGGSAELHVATDVHLLVDGREVDGLPGKFACRLLENAALLQVAASGGEIVNDTGFPPGELWEM